MAENANMKQAELEHEVLMLNIEGTHSNSTILLRSFIKHIRYDNQSSSNLV